MDKPLKILITGEKGYLGACVTALLKADPRYQPCFLHERLQALRPGSLQADRLIHLAVRRPGAHVSEQALFADNFQGTASLLRALSSAIPVIFLSSTRVYGLLQTEKLFTEEDTPQPACAYGESKLAAENHLRQNLSAVCILRSCALFGYGLGQAGRTVIDLFWQQQAAQLPLTVFQPDSLRNYLYVWDLARWVVELLQWPVSRWPDCLNVTAQYRSLQGMLAELIAASPLPPPQLCYQQQVGQASHFARVSSQRWQTLREPFGLTPDAQIMQAYWQAHRERCSR